LFGVKPYDPLILSTTLLVLCGAAFLAALLPARAAAGLEPMRALRTD
jgi:putative ABC transport system permease protein